MTESPTSAARDRRLARYYDLDLRDVHYDAELYQQLALEGGGPVLELGAGSGRIAVPLALAGHQVLGIDTDEAMLERGQRYWEDVRGEIEPTRLRLERGDFLDLRTDARFGLVLMAVNTFLVAEDDQARLSILTRMRQSLRPGGIAAVEVGTPDARELERFDGRQQHEWLRVDPETGEEVTKTISAVHDPADGSVLLTQVYEWTAPGGGTVGRVTHQDLIHLVSAERLGQLAREAGFDTVELKGDHLSTPHGPTSHRVILVARLV
ncbi:MAG: class I SAM-dependent methyltransferase [Candidatus Limnocylindrales bacterium]